MNTVGYAAPAVGAPLVPFRFERRDLRPDDVRIEILYCGVCHSDLHVVRNDWHGSVYPVVPGHEIVGRVTAVGPRVTRHAEGDVVAVGCMVDSCSRCAPCLGGDETFCVERATQTYNGNDRVTGENTYGGYSTHIVVRDHFVLKVPASLDVKRVAPILCAGITTYSPLRRYGVGRGTRVAILGLGGLGHMGVKLAAALGARVTLVTRSESKTADALALGAHSVLLSGDAAAMQSAAGTFDFILDTIPVGHDVAPYLPLLAIDGVHVIVGAIDMLPAFHSGLLLMGRKRLTASAIGGIPETQEVLEFCAEHGIMPDCEMIRIEDINDAYGRMERAQVKYRFVIDMASLAS